MIGGSFSMDNNFLDDLMDINVGIKEVSASSLNGENSNLKEKVHTTDVILHASQLSKVMVGQLGLTEKQDKDLKEFESKRDNPVLINDKQKEEIAKLEAKENPTANQKLKLSELIEKRDNPKPKGLTENQKEDLKKLYEKRDDPKLGRTAISYIDEIITTELYGIGKNINSKYFDHGNANELHSIMMLNDATGQNFKKYEGKPKTDLEYLLEGTPDIDCPELDCIIDIKNPYDTHTFDRNREFKLTDETTGEPTVDKVQREYYWQMQCYMHLFDRSCSYLVYTLNENQYMEGHEYGGLGTLDRIIIKKCLRDVDAMNRYKDRIPAIQNAILDAKKKRVESMTETAVYLMELTA